MEEHKQGHGLQYVDYLVNPQYAIYRNQLMSLHPNRANTKKVCYKLITLIQTSETTLISFVHVTHVLHFKIYMRLYAKQFAVC